MSMKPSNERISHYDLLKESSVSDIDGEKFPDIKSIDFTKFKPEVRSRSHEVTDTDIDAPYLLSNRYYNSTDYDGILLLLNQIDLIDKLRFISAGEVHEEFISRDIDVYSLSDIEKFIFEHRRRS